MLFDPKSSNVNPNDPFMINPKGFKVTVPEKMVKELLAKGFTLVDKKWKPTEVIRAEKERDYPLPMEELKQEVAQDIDILEVTEI